MAGALSDDLRRRVVEAVEAGESRGEVCIRFGVSYSSVNRWVSRFRQTGSVSPSKIGGYCRPVLINEWDFICSCMKECPHITLNGLCKRLKIERGIQVSHVTVWHMLRRGKMSFKKKHFMQLSEIAPTL